LFFGSGVARADVFINFETNPGAYLLQAWGGTAALSTDQAHSATHSAKLQLTDISNDESRVRFDVTGQLGNAVTSYWSYVPGSGTSNLIPYVMYYVDSNNNGVMDSIAPGGDSYVIEFANGSFNEGQWIQTVFDSSVNVHVVGNRDGLGICDFSSSCGGGLLSALDATTNVHGGGTWGGATVWAAYVDTGNWNGIGGYTAYVDDINYSAAPVPEPSAIVLLGSIIGFVGLSARRRRRVQENV
jgi:hypothetical protein